MPANGQLGDNLLAAPGWAEQLLADREATLAGFRDGQRSPYAAVARHDFPGASPLLLGSAEDCDVRLEGDGIEPHHARIRVEGDGFVLEAVDPGATLRVHQRGAPPASVREARAPTGAKVELGRFLVRLSHQNFPALLVLDPGSPRLKEGPPPRWFAPDPAFRVQATLERDPAPREEVVLSTRGNKRRALRVGHFRFQVQGAPLSLLALRLLEPGSDEASLSVFFRDTTSGHESYPVGRYLEPQPVDAGAGAWVLDFNRCYNPTCAFSPLYNCPIPPRENLLAVAIRAGEQDPGAHA